MRIGSLFIDTGGSVMDWFVARATGGAGHVESEQRKMAKEVISKVKTDLEKLGFLGVTVTWSSKAGCSCGCSPGYMITGTAPNKDVEFWIKHSGKGNQSYTISYYFRVDGQKLERKLLGGESSAESLCRHLGIGKSEIIK